MLDYALFSRMPRNATFLNTGRGAQVVEADLVRALREAPDRTAVLDVTFPEPPAADSPLNALPNVFLTPHIAGSKGREVERMGAYMAEERCLSHEEIVSVKRFAKVKVSFEELVDGKLVARRRDYTGFVAQMVQHMIDHCLGKLV